MKGRIEFECSDKELTRGFQWAKEQALAYSHEGDPVGCWYEAALPGREAFCMRDVSHQARGAHVLGLEQHTKNMMLHFARSIAEQRDYCCYWEINRYDQPAPVDYTSDEDFWYNLPANFDVLDACYRMYQLTGDRDYLEDRDMLRFYNLSMNEYIQRWDRDGDGIPEARPNAGRRGIPSYEEFKGEGSAQMIDLLAAQQKGFRSYAEMQKLTGDTAAAEKSQKIAAEIQDSIDRSWWDASSGRFFYCKGQDGSYQHIPNAPDEAFLYFDAVSDPRKRQLTLDVVEKRGRQGIAVEPMSHLAEIFYRYGDPVRGEYWLRKKIDPELDRKEYPEISYTTVGDYIFDMMGISYDPETKSIAVRSQLPKEVSYAAVYNLPVYGREADVVIENGVSKITMK